MRHLLCVVYVPYPPVQREVGLGLLDYLTWDTELGPGKAEWQTGLGAPSVYKTLTLASGQESGASGESVQEVGGSELPPGRVSSTITPLPLLHDQHIPHVGLSGD